LAAGSASCSSRPDRQTGKTAIALDTIINSKGTEKPDLHLLRDRAEAVVGCAAL